MVSSFAISLMVTFWLTLGLEGIDQLSSGLSSEAVSQDKPHFLSTGLLIFSSFLLTVTVCPPHHSVSTGLRLQQPALWGPWFPHSPHLSTEICFHSIFPFTPQTGAFTQPLSGLNGPIRPTTCLFYVQTVFLLGHNTLARGKEFTLTTKQANYILSTQSLNDN